MTFTSGILEKMRNEKRERRNVRLTAVFLLFGLIAWGYVLLDGGCK